MCEMSVFFQLWPTPSILSYWLVSRLDNSLVNIRDSHFFPFCTVNVYMVSNKDMKNKSLINIHCYLWIIYADCLCYLLT